jgi:peroxiredoxin
MKTTEIVKMLLRFETLGTNWIKSCLSVIVLLLSVNSAIAQGNDYDLAVGKFTGEHKYDIERPGALDGVTAPEFSGKSLDGKTIRLSKLKGKVVVLNFWFIACAPCRIEVTPLNKIVKQFKGKDVVFISVARDKDADLIKHLQTVPFAFKVIADPTAAISGDIYHLFGYPTTIVIDKLGKIRYYTLGGKITEDAVSKELNEKLVPVINNYLVEKG